jgi:trk system potassium uptake protein TrkA
MGREYLVIGAGQFGKSVAENLTRLRQSVLVVDIQQKIVESIADEVDAAVTADATDEAALVELEAASVTTAIVTIGTEAVEASILATALLKQLGVPRIIARATNPLHARVLHSVGADEVIAPEEEIGRRLATRLAHPTIKDQLDLGSASLAEVRVPEKFAGRSLRELNIRQRYNVTVIGIQRGGQIMPSPRADEKLSGSDVLLIIGTPDAVQAVADMV